MIKRYVMTFLIAVMVMFMTGYTLMESKTENKGIPKKETFLQYTYQDPGLKKVIQIALVVKDIEAASKKWGELLDMPVPEIRTTRPGHEVKVIYRGKPSEGQAKLTFFNLGQVVLELLEPVGEGTSWKEFLDTRGEGVQHIGFNVVDLVKATQQLENAGYQVMHQGRYDSDDGTYVYFDSQDDLGVVVELLHSDPK